MNICRRRNKQKTFSGQNNSRIRVNSKYSKTKYSKTNYSKTKYSKTCLKQPLKKDKTKNLRADGSLMKVGSIAECSLGAYLQDF